MKSISALSSISVPCPNMNYWYAYVKYNISTYSSLTSSAITELGSVMGNEKKIKLFNTSSEK